MSVETTDTLSENVITVDFETAVEGTRSRHLTESERRTAITSAFEEDF